jgi:hypothetical protein
MFKTINTFLVKTPPCSRITIPRLIGLTVILLIKHFEFEKKVCILLFTDKKYGKNEYL